MRAGNLRSRVKFYDKVTTRDTYGASVDTWPIATITTRGEVRYTGGNYTLSNEEKFYSKFIELRVRYRSTITETMRVQIDGTSALYNITYLEIVGNKEGLKLTLEKLNDELPLVATLPPTAFTATGGGMVYNTIALAWTNNAANDGVVIERSLNGNDFTEIVRIPKATIPVASYDDEDLAATTTYFYRVKAFNYTNYSAYTTVAVATTDAEP
jgi:head-tail adaptor